MATDPQTQSLPADLRPCLRRSVVWTSSAVDKVWKGPQQGSMHSTRRGGCWSRIQDFYQGRVEKGRQLSCWCWFLKTRSWVKWWFLPLVVGNKSVVWRWNDIHVIKRITMKQLSISRFSTRCSLPCIKDCSKKSAKTNIKHRVSAYPRCDEYPRIPFFGGVQSWHIDPAIALFPKHITFRCLQVMGLTVQPPVWLRLVFVDMKIY